MSQTTTVVVLEPSGLITVEAWVSDAFDNVFRFRVELEPGTDMADVRVDGILAGACYYDRAAGVLSLLPPALIVAEEDGVREAIELALRSGEGGRLRGVL